MRRSSMLVVLIMCGLIVGGCLNTGNSGNKMQGENEDTKDNENDKQNAYEQENYVPIQEYTGEGFTLRDANPKTGEIAEANREEVVHAVEGLYKNKYNTEVDVHNIVSAVDGVSVFGEPIGEPHFYSFAIVPIDIKNEEVKVDQVWSQEGQVEYAIKGGLYAMAFEEQFTKLDEYLESVAKEYPVVGTPINVIESIKGNGYTTTYYFIASSGDVFEDLYGLYIQNTDIKKVELKLFFNEQILDPKYLSVGIEFYMQDQDVDPDEDILNNVIKDLEEIKGIPQGVYSITLNDNYIDGNRGIGKKDSTLRRTTPNKVIKE